MRDLLQPRVLQQASVAALVSALACYPRISLWSARPEPVWYLETVLFLCGIVLWGFVFAWHTPYSRRPVFIFNLKPDAFVAATLLGIGAAIACHLWLDPLLRPQLPEEYPADLEHWFAMMLFALALNQLFVVFAAFDWLMRLLKRRWLAASLTALFGAGVLAMKLHSLPTPISPSLWGILLAGRIIAGLLAVWFYLRGGVILVWWWTFLLGTRHLFDWTGHA